MQQNFLTTKTDKDEATRLQDYPMAHTMMSPLKTNLTTKDSPQAEDIVAAETCISVHSDSGEKATAVRQQLMLQT